MKKSKGGSITLTKDEWLLLSAGHSQVVDDILSILAALESFEQGVHPIQALLNIGTDRVVRATVSLKAEDAGAGPVGESSLAGPLELLKGFLVHFAEEHLKLTSDAETRRRLVRRGSPRGKRRQTAERAKKPRNDELVEQARRALQKEPRQSQIEVLRDLLRKRNAADGKHSTGRATEKDIDVRAKSLQRAIRRGATQGR